MNCLKCGKAAIPVIFQSHLITVSKIFCLTISDIIDGTPRPKARQDDRHKIIDNIHFHRKDLCEACKLGVCYATKK
jgi:hypothetical protein